MQACIEEWTSDYDSGVCVCLYRQEAYIGSNAYVDLHIMAEAMTLSSQYTAVSALCCKSLPDVFNAQTTFSKKRVSPTRIFAVPLPPCQMRTIRDVGVDMTVRSRQPSCCPVLSTHGTRTLYLLLSVKLWHAQCCQSHAYHLKPMTMGGVPLVTRSNQVTKSGHKNVRTTHKILRKKLSLVLVILWVVLIMNHI